MNLLPLKFAWRYIFAKRSVNVINLITGLSVFGLGVGAAAVILVLSVFNGFEQVIGAMFGKFNPSIKITPAIGKTFSSDSIPLDQIRGVAGIRQLSLTLEETVFFEYEESRAFGKIKGVDSLFTEVSTLGTTLIEGTFSTENNGRAMGILGLGLRNKLDVNSGDLFKSIRVYAAKRQSRGAFDQPFRIKEIYPQATFAIQQDYDQQYMFTNLAAVQSLLGSPNAASAIEIATEEDVDSRELADQLQELLGDTYVVEDRYEQDAELLRLMNIEKWLSYIILSLVLLLVSFNLIGGLWLIVLEKQRDVAILRAMGTQTNDIRRIFLGVGILLSVLGAALGVFLALVLYYLQVNFGIVSVPEGLVVSAYPIEMRFSDVLIVVVTVLCIGLIASIPATRRATRIGVEEM
ncbi:MAG: FtsX-like permease family protein [Saprospiraceae bacterium]